MAETPYPNNSHTARERKPEGSNPPEKKLEKVVSLLCNGVTLPPAYKDHLLMNSRNYKGMRECHIEPDWLLVYKIRKGA
jgi:mRNA interferase YafQ